MFTCLYNDLENIFEQIGVDRYGVALIKEDQADVSIFFSFFPTIASEQLWQRANAETQTSAVFQRTGWTENEY